MTRLSDYLYKYCEIFFHLGYDNIIIDGRFINPSIEDSSQRAVLKIKYVCLSFLFHSFNIFTLNEEIKPLSSLKTFYGQTSPAEELRLMSIKGRL